MSWLMASQVAERLNASLEGADVPVERVITDTRKPDAQALFFALQGPNFDAHEALESLPAEASPVAAALVVAREVDYPAPQIRVDDTRLALGRLAASWREDFSGKLVGLTGSNGKTTVKEMLASIFAQQGNVLATEGNLNNDIGMPLTLLKLRAGDDVAVIEMGANHPGEIAYLTDIARPDVALVNNAAAAHLEGFGSIEGVAHAKAEIYAGLREGGTAVINLDDRYAAVWQEAAKDHAQISFGENDAADVRLLSMQPLTLATPEGQISLNLPLLGRHNAMNAAAATATALAAGASLASIKAGLQAMQPVSGRLREQSGLNGSRIIDDSYNANPGSIRAAIDTLAAQRGVTVLVLGDMAEVGENAASLHAELGRYAREAGVDGFLATGPMMAHAVAEFGPGASHYDSHEALAAALTPVLSRNSVVLVKGSRSMQMERVVALLSASSHTIQGSGHAA